MRSVSKLALQSIRYRGAHQPTVDASAGISETTVSVRYSKVAVPRSRGAKPLPQSQKNDSTQKTRIAAVFQAGGVLLQLGEANAAQELYELAASTFKEIGDIALLHAARGGLANALQQQGQITAALKLYKDVVAAKTDLHGADSDQTLTSRENFAVALSENGQLEQAQHELEDVVLGFERCARRKGNSDETTEARREILHAKANLADVMRRRGDFAGCADILGSVADGIAHLLGPGHWEALHAQVSQGSALVCAAAEVIFPQGLSSTNARPDSEAVAAATKQRMRSDGHLSDQALDDMARGLQMLEMAVPPLQAQLGARHCDVEWANEELRKARVAVVCATQGALGEKKTLIGN